MNLSQLVQNALATFLAGQTLADIPSTHIYRGIQHEDLEVESKIKWPCVICNCEDVQFELPERANGVAQAVVTVVSSADDTTHIRHLERAEAVADSLLTTSIAEDLSAAIDNFTAFLVNFQSMGNTRSERAWHSMITLRIVCAPSDIT